jgi:hypothetical protein
MRWYGRAAWSATTTPGSGAKGWGFKDVLPTYKAQEDWEGGANQWRGVGGPVHIRKPGDPHPTAPAFIEAARQMGFPIIDDANGPMRPGAGYINMNIAADGSRVSSSRAFLRPNLDRPNLTLLLNTNVTKVVFNGDRASGVELITKPIANLRSVGQNLQDHVLVSGLVYQYKGKMPTVRRTATRLRPKSTCRAASTVTRPTSTLCWSSFRSRLQRRPPVSALPRKKVSRSRPRSFSRPAVAMCGLPARIGAMRPS